MPDCIVSIVESDLAQRIGKVSDGVEACSFSRGTE
jgi:hypothetical protein